MKSFEDAESGIRAAYDRRKADPAAEHRSSWFDKENLFLQQEREQKILELLAREKALDLSQLKILEVGCGTGYFLREFIKWGARPENVAGVDLRDDDVAYARARCPPSVRVQTGAGEGISKTPHPKAATTPI